MDHLQTEGRNPASTNLDELNPLQIVQLMNAEDAEVIAAVASQAEAIARAITIIADCLRPADLCRRWNLRKARHARRN